MPWCADAGGGRARADGPDDGGGGGDRTITVLARRWPQTATRRTEHAAREMRDVCGLRTRSRSQPTIEQPSSCHGTAVGPSSPCRHRAIAPAIAPPSARRHRAIAVLSSPHRPAPSGCAIGPPMSGPAAAALVLGARVCTRRPRRLRASPRPPHPRTDRPAGRRHRHRHHRLAMQQQQPAPALHRAVAAVLAAAAVVLSAAAVDVVPPASLAPAPYASWAHHHWSAAAAVVVAAAGGRQHRAAGQGLA